MTTIDEVLEDMYQAYNPPGHYHAPMGDAKYLSGSMIVSRTALEMLEAIRNPGGGDDVPKYYTFRGDTLASEAFRAWEHEEIRVAHPVERYPDWSIIHHMDATGIFTNQMGDDALYVGEHKSHGHGTIDKWEIATRQGANALACMLSLHEANGYRKMEFAPAAWEENSPSFWLPQGAITPGGVVVAIADDALAKGDRKLFEFSGADLEEFRVFYQNKAAAIISDYMSGTEHACTEWDETSGEFADSIIAAVGDMDLAEDLQRRYELVRAIKENEAEKKILDARIRLAIGQDGNAIRSGNYAARMIHRKGNRNVSVKDIDAILPVLPEEARSLVEGVIKHNPGYSYVEVSHDADK